MGHRVMGGCLRHGGQGASLINMDLNKVLTLLLTAVTLGHQEKAKMCIIIYFRKIFMKTT